MKNTVKALLPVIILVMAGYSCSAQNTLEKLGWKLGTQAWSFHQYTFYQAIDSTLACGLHYIEAFPQQEIGGGLPGTMDYHMSPATREKILAHLKEKGVTLVSYGVVNANNTDQSWDSLFEFAHAMHLLNIVSEPNPKFINVISKLCDKYDINFAIHNHPLYMHDPYWSPDIVLKLIAGQSKHVGACADLGHWASSYLSPLDCLKKLQGHIIEIHFKDLNEMGPKGHCVPWGTGVENTTAIIHWLYQHHFKGVISAEYEYDWGNNVHDIRQSVAYFKKVVATL
jgi:sugar phosphate isomerase/epimerase